MGAMTEIGPFGVNPDGKMLYTRTHAWNKVANILFVESPAGVGFSYSNTTSDYKVTADKRTGKLSHKKQPPYTPKDELADTIIKRNKEVDPILMIQLKGIMGLIGYLINKLRIESADPTEHAPEMHHVEGAFVETLLPKAKSPPQDALLKLETEQTFTELSQESSMFVFKLGLVKLQCCLLMNGLVVDANEEDWITPGAIH
ncbi:unnamed protein product [Camellia sinensis]